MEAQGGSPVKNKILVIVLVISAAAVLVIFRAAIREEMAPYRAGIEAAEKLR